MDGNKPILDECINMGEWRTILHPQYINCYSFILLERFSNKTNTIELFIYLAEEVNTTECMDCFFSNVKTQLSGAVLVIHNRASYPDINQEGVNLQPGTLTEVKLKTIKNIMKTPPYGRCSWSSATHLQMNNEQYRYTEKACKYITFQRKINEECECATLEYPLLDDNTLPLCNSLPNFIVNTSCQQINAKNLNITLNQRCIEDMERAVNKTICKNDIIGQYYGDGIDGCNLPCEFYSYETDRSISTWPTKSYHLNWIQSSVAKRIRLKPELRNYQNALDKLDADNEEAAYEILMNENVLEKRLVGVVINKPDYKLHLVEEKEVLSLTSFLSQSGGLFSIWIGLTLINTVEIIEMLIRFADVCSNNSKMKIKELENTEKEFEPSMIRSYLFNDGKSHHVEDGDRQMMTNKCLYREAIL